MGDTRSFLDLLVVFSLVFEGSRILRFTGF